MIQNVVTLFKDTFTQMIEDFLGRIIGLLDSIIQAFLELPLKIYEKIRALFEEFFVPDEGIINGYLTDIRSRFAFIDSIAGYGDHIVNFLQVASGTEAPVFTIDLSKKGGKYSWGNQKIVVDFAWYAPYKPLVDNIVAGIIWVTFLWHMYKRIPEIIHGQGMVTGKALDILEKR